MLSNPRTGVQSYAALLYNMLWPCLMFPDRYKEVLLKSETFHDHMTAYFGKEWKRHFQSKRWLFQFEKKKSFNHEIFFFSNPYTSERTYVRGLYSMLQSCSLPSKVKKASLLQPKCTSWLHAFIFWKSWSPYFLEKKPRFQFL